MVKTPCLAERGHLTLLTVWTTGHLLSIIVKTDGSTLFRESVSLKSTQVCGIFSQYFLNNPNIHCISLPIIDDLLMIIGDVLSFCSANKKAIAADSLNAAHFINCSNSNSNLSKYIQECTYPQLFSVETNSCQDFRTVPVDSRIVPQAPCELVFVLSVFTYTFIIKHSFVL